MEPSTGFSSSRQGSPSSLTRRLSWGRSAAAAPRESFSLTDNDNYNYSDNNQRSSSSSRRPFRHEIHSQASDLDSPVYAPGDGDDTVHLTSHSSVWRRSAAYERDLERRPGSKRADNKGRALRAMRKTIRRASIRVVNFAGVGLDERPVRLDDFEDIQEGQRHIGAESNAVPTLRGKTLALFGATNPVRLAMHKVLSSTYTEALILLLIIANAAVLTIQSVRHVLLQITPESGYFNTWEDYALFSLFCLYTIEALGRIIVSGLLIDPEIPFSSLKMSFSGLRRQGSLTSRISSVRPRFIHNGSSIKSTILRTPSATAGGNGVGRVPMWEEKNPGGSQAHLLNKSPYLSASTSTTPPSNSSSRFALQNTDIPFSGALRTQLHITTSRPYLRHSWNRVDLLAIVSFWIMFVLCLSHKETTQDRHLYIFRALSVLRTTRLLAITSGTTTIMTSLKRAAPQLVNVTFFVAFAIGLFGIVGVQSFKGSFRRSCEVQVEDQTITLDQHCGGHIDPTTLQPTGFITMGGENINNPKGFICPLGQVCRESDSNPQSDASHFDNILGASLQIAIIASANGWSDNMYSMMSADFFISCIFFILCIIVLNFWLLNLFVAVITQSFSASRAEGGKSAFGAEGDVIPVFDDKDDDWVPTDRNQGPSILQRIYKRVEPFFALLALASLMLQAIKTTTTPERILRIAFLCEIGITLAFIFEIIWRILATLPLWRKFFSTKQNIVDLFLAITCGIILIPPIPSTPAYPWLTAFQLMRFYRVILFVPGMKALLFQVFGNLRGLWNMSIFLLLANFLAALFATQLFRGDVPADFTMNFHSIVSSFLAMYQVFTSENWTDIMWEVANDEFPFKMQVIAILFIVFWFFFANFIMLQMFIAVINENFEVAEEQKRARQVRDFVQRAGPTTMTVNWFDRINPYRKMRANPKAVNVNTLPEHLVLPLKKSLVREYRAPGESSGVNTARGLRDTPIIQGPLGTMRRLMGMDQNLEHVPLAPLKGTRPASQGPRDLLQVPGNAPQTPGDPLDADETERHFEALNAINNDTTPEDDMAARDEARNVKRDFISDHPSYDKTLWIFAQTNPIRRFCQRLVPPSNGDQEERIFGIPPSPWLSFGFRAIMLITVIAGIVVAAIAGPLYRRDYFARMKPTQIAWFDLAEAVFGFLLVLEFFIKIIADGFVFTPNAYLLNIWNILDMIILIAILVNVATSLLVLGGVSRGTRALKAFRALRLITLIGWMRETFHSVIFAGARRILDAAVLAILYMIPYAVWGLNIFSGRMFACNDGNALGKDDCQNEYFASPVDDSLSFIAPRVWDNPSPSTSFSFDSFPDSFLILFEIVSLEGWTDVLEAALGISGDDKQPGINVSRINALFFVLYNLLGAVVILTLFVSIIISNFSSRSGMALLTTEQRQWIDLQKLISRQKPSKRPHIPPKGKLAAWCFERAVKKRGWWSRGMTILYCVQIAILMSQTFTDSKISDQIRDFVFLGLAFCFLADPVVKFYGLGWKYFRANGWNIFDVVVILGSIATTLAIILGVGGFSVRQSQKLFLVCVAFKLMQKLDSLNQLFKTAVSSLSVIAKLFGLWFSLFLFFGILWLEVFALTKWGSGETPDQNYQSLGRTLVMLAFMSTGEQWNQYMHDYAISYPRCTNSSESLEESDCGSKGWSFTLFIAWNVLSMYIFVNMFTGVVVENFSYIYQQRRNQTLNREEMRSFKKVWAQFDRDSTGYLKRQHLVKFLGKLSGVFEATPTDDFVPDTQVGSLDLRRLAKNLSTLDNEEIRKRRRLYCRIYWEAQFQSRQDPQDRGISFRDMLLLLAHHKLIDDEKALRVDEIIRRKAITDQVEDRVNFDKVRSLFRMILHRKKFLADRKARRASFLPHIVVQTEASPQVGSFDITRRSYATHHSLSSVDLAGNGPQENYSPTISNRLSSNNWPRQVNPYNQSRSNNPFSDAYEYTPTTPRSPSAMWSDPTSPSNRGPYQHDQAFSTISYMDTSSSPGRNPYRSSDLSVGSTGSPNEASTLSRSYGSPRGGGRRTTMVVEDQESMIRQIDKSIWAEMLAEMAEESEEGEGEGHRTGR